MTAQGDWVTVLGVVTQAGDVCDVAVPPDGTGATVSVPAAYLRPAFRGAGPVRGRSDQQPDGDRDALAFAADLDRCQHGQRSGEACPACPSGRSGGNPLARGEGLQTPDGQVILAYTEAGDWWVLVRDQSRAGPRVELRYRNPPGETPAAPAPGPPAPPGTGRVLVGAGQ